MYVCMHACMHVCKETVEGETERVREAERAQDKERQRQRERERETNRWTLKASSLISYIDLIRTLANTEFPKPFSRSQVSPASQACFVAAFRPAAR